MLKKIKLQTLTTPVKAGLVAATLLLTAQIANAATQVTLKTTAGDIEIELNEKQAPVSTQNFIEYAKSGFYKDTIFHRVIPGFMIQAGGFTADMKQKPTRAPIQNEANNGLKNERGTLAMARTQSINSATSQFFINLNNNTALDHGTRDYGYAVFGKVTKGMDIVDQIAKVPTTTKGMYANVPQQPIKILSVTVKNSK